MAWRIARVGEGEDEDGEVEGTNGEYAQVESLYS